MKIQLPRRFKTVTMTNKVANDALIKAAQQHDQFHQPKHYKLIFSMERPTLGYYSAVDQLVRRLKQKKQLEPFIQTYIRLVLER